MEILKILCENQDVEQKFRLREIKMSEASDANEQKSASQERNEDNAIRITKSSERYKSFERRSNIKKMSRS